MNPDVHRAWLDLTEDYDFDGGLFLTGTRSAFEQLRDALQETLDDSDGTVVVVAEGTLSISSLKVVSEAPVPIAPSTGQRFMDAFIRNGCLVFIVAFLLCAAVGLIHLTTLILE